MEKTTREFINFLFDIVKKNLINFLKFLKYFNRVL